MHDGGAPELASSARPIPESSLSSFTLRGCAPARRAPASPLAGTSRCGPESERAERAVTVVLASRFDITPEAVLAVAWKGEPVAVDAAALGRVAASRAAFMRYLDEDPNASVYGVNQGQGEMVGRTLDDDDRRRLARLKPLAAAVAFGEPYPHRVTRAMVLARLRQPAGRPWHGDAPAGRGARRDVESRPHSLRAETGSGRAGRDPGPVHAVRRVVAPHRAAGRGARRADQRLPRLGRGPRRCGAERRAAGRGGRAGAGAGDRGVQRPARALRHGTG